MHTCGLKILLHKIHYLNQFNVYTLQIMGNEAKYTNSISEFIQHQKAPPPCFIFTAMLPKIAQF